MKKYVRAAGECRHGASAIAPTDKEDHSFVCNRRAYILGSFAIVLAAFLFSSSAVRGQAALGKNELNASLICQSHRPLFFSWVEVSEGQSLREREA